MDRFPENRGAGGARTPVFGLLMFRDLLIFRILEGSIEKKSYGFL
jgi:hypothetical protein